MTHSFPTRRSSVLDPVYKRFGASRAGHDSSRRTVDLYQPGDRTDPLQYRNGVPVLQSVSASHRAAEPDSRADKAEADAPAGRGGTRHVAAAPRAYRRDRQSTRLNSSH